MSRNQREGRYLGWKKFNGARARHWREGEPLPDGLTRRGGQFYFDCEGCERECEWDGTKEDFDHPDAIRLGGCSPHCCP